MSFAFSSSNLSTFRQCPRKFQAQSITKEIKWQASQQKSRGTLVHTALEKATKRGFDSVQSWPDGLDMGFVQSRINTVRQCVASGADVFNEHELAITRSMKPSDWWDENTWLRAKADLVILPTQQDLPVVVVDYKTGKKWDEDDFQLRLEALLLYFIYGRPRVQYSYWYVDQGDTVSGLLDFSQSMDSVVDIVGLIRQAELAINGNNFFPKKNRFCKWCGLYKTPGCGL